jgi:hypothetical protein
MKLHLLFFTFLLVFISFPKLFSQDCSFDIERSRLRQNPDYVQIENAAEARIQNVISNNLFERRNGDILTIPVVIHVLHLGENVGDDTNISDAQIQSSIDNLNLYYIGQSPNSPVDFEIEFVLAKRDPNCNATTGINRIDASGVANYSANGVSFNGGAGANQDTLKDLSRWPETDYFNIWIVSQINGNNGGSGYQGYANFYYGNTREGSVMMHTVFGFDPTNAQTWDLNFDRDNSTVVHEAGHYFHLFHTFQGDDTNNDGVSDSCPADITTTGNNPDSDGCAETVPHQRETSTCPATNTCTGNPWVDNNTINNIMSYYNCADRLTNDQKTRARFFMEGTALVNSKGGEPIDVSYAAPAATCSTNTASIIDNNYAGIVNVELNGNSFASFSTLSDGGNIDSSDNCNNYFEIDATTTNTLNVTMFPSHVQHLGVWVDWNDDGDFNDEAEEQITVIDGIAEGSIESINLIYPTTVPYGDYVRIRLITELSNSEYGISLISSACYSSLLYGQSEDYTIYIEPAGSTTYTYTNAWSPSDPVGVATLSDDIIIDSGTANISSNTSCNTITVNPGAALTIDSGVTLTTTTVDLNSTSQLFSSLISDGTIAGTINYNRYTSQVAPTGTNDLISAPLSGQNFGDFANANSNLEASGTVRLFGPYSTTNGDYENYDTTTNAVTSILSGLGYRAATTDGSTLTFTGNALNTNVLDVPISDDDSGYAWNLIGNPYPSYIDFDTFFQLNKSEFDSASVYQAIYGYDGNASNGWTVWNQATIDEGSIIEVIAPGQGFFVKAKSDGGLVDFTTAMRTTGSSDDFISGRQTVSNAVLCKLNLNSNSNSTSTFVYFIEGTTRGLDVGYDAGTYAESSAEYSIFSNLVENNTGLSLAIQTLPYNDFNDVVIPLGINAGANTELNISIDTISTLPDNINVYLEDNVKNTLTLLNDTDYTFISETELNGTGRFFIRYSSVTLSTEDSNWNDLIIYATSNPKQLVIKGQLNNKTKAMLYDIQGRVVLSQNLDEFNTENSIDISKIGTGIYIVKVSNENQIKTQKLIIR